MNEITNKHILVTMIIIGVITIGLLLSQRQVVSSYSYGNNFGASAYDAGSYGTTNNLDLSISRPGVYVPYLRTNYTVSPYRTSNTRTTTTSYTVPSNNSYSYYSTSSYQLPDESGYNGSYYGSGDQGYVPPGCESGTDYSTTTNEPCG